MYNMAASLSLQGVILVVVLITMEELTTVHSCFPKSPVPPSCIKEEESCKENIKCCTDDLVCYTLPGSKIRRCKTMDFVYATDPFCQKTDKQCMNGITCCNKKDTCYRENTFWKTRAYCRSEWYFRLMRYKCDLGGSYCTNTTTLCCHDSKQCKKIKTVADPYCRNITHVPDGTLLPGPPF